MWEAKNKRDLVIEVWEKLDCDTVGATEIEAIEEALRDVYGEAAIETPMRLARMLADEGAELRHSEIMNLFVARYEAEPYTAEFRNIFKLDTLAKARSSIRNLENLRRKFETEGDKNGVRLIRERAVEAKSKLGGSAIDREVTQWLTVWLQTPEAFENWLSLRKRSKDYNEKFGEKNEE